jgi:hypothetical protein
MSKFSPEKLFFHSFLGRISVMIQKAGCYKENLFRRQTVNQTKKKELKCHLE